MPSLNSNRIHQFLDIFEAKPTPIKIFYNNGVRYPLIPYKNGWRILFPKELLQDLARYGSDRIPNLQQLEQYRMRYAYY